jgi:hypothetical protein
LAKPTFAVDDACGRPQSRRHLSIQFALILLQLHSYSTSIRSPAQKSARGRGTPAILARFHGQTPARYWRHRGGTAMWISLFSIVTAISIGLAVGAMILEGQQARKPRKARVSVVR